MKARPSGHVPRTRVRLLFVLGVHPSRTPLSGSGKTSPGPSLEGGEKERVRGQGTPLEPLREDPCTPLLAGRTPASLQWGRLTAAPRK